MCDKNIPEQKKQDVTTQQKYHSPCLVQYGNITKLTQGSSGSRADGQGSLGPGNQGVAS